MEYIVSFIGYLLVVNFHVFVLIAEGVLNVTRMINMAERVIFVV